MKAPFNLHLGDTVNLMRAMPANSVDSVIADGPYGLGFMGKAWDGDAITKRATDRRAAASSDPQATEMGGHKSNAAAAGLYDLSPSAMRAFQEFSREWGAEALRVLKPGGHLLSFCAPRTYHRMTCGLEDAGFEIRDQCMWIFAQGFPKSHNLADEWEGWGTALKPAHEPIAMARKPLAKGHTVAASMLAHGTGALNIADCRVGNASTARTTAMSMNGGNLMSQSPGEKIATGGDMGRWPANLMHDGSAVVLEAFPDAPGQQAPASTSTKPRNGQNVYGSMARGRGTEPSADSENAGAVGFKMKPRMRRDDAGSAARFFFCPKASRQDRNEGLPSFAAPAVRAGATMGDRERADWEARNGNHHPTVKPTELMRYLCRLVTQPGGIILDPFMGSGSTGKAAMLEGFRFIGNDENPAYVEIARARILWAWTQRLHATRQPSLFAEA